MADHEPHVHDLDALLAEARDDDQDGDEWRYFTFRGETFRYARRPPLRFLLAVSKMEVAFTRAKSDREKAALDAQALDEFGRCFEPDQFTRLLEVGLTDEGLYLLMDRVIGPAWGLSMGSEGAAVPVDPKTAVAVSDTERQAAS